MPSLPDPRSMIVRAQRSSGDVVHYDVFSSRVDPVLLKTTRFSELSQLHHAIMREMPDFQGALPRKTFRKHTDAAFIEGRRNDIEVYLCVASAYARQCVAFQTFFFGAPHVSPPSSERERQRQKRQSASAEAGELDTSWADAGVYFAGDAGDDSDGDDSSMNLGATAINKELLAELNRSEAVALAKKVEAQTYLELLSKKEDIEVKLASADKASESDRRMATKNIAAEAAAKQHLIAHVSSIQELVAELNAQHSIRKKNEVEQNEAANRLTRDLSNAETAVQTANKQDSDARIGLCDVKETARLQNAKFEDALTAAEGNHASSTELKESFDATFAVLNSRSKNCAAEQKNAEREHAQRKQEKEDLDNERLTAEKARHDAEDAARTAAAACVSFGEDASRRKRAHDLKISRNRERLSVAKKLCDMTTRSQIQSDDRMDLAEVVEKSDRAFHVANLLLEAVSQRAAETKEADQRQAEIVKQAADKAARLLERCAELVATLDERIAERDTVLRKAEIALFRAAAAAKAASNELDTSTSRAKENKKALEGYTSKLAAVTVDVTATRASLETNLIPLQRAEHAEVLKSHVASITHALGLALTTAKEAHDEEARTTAQEWPASQPRMAASFIITSCEEARLAHQRRLSEEAASASAAALAAVNVARKELAGARIGCHKEGPESSEPIASAEARVAKLDQSVQEKESASEAALAAARAACEELTSLEAQQQTKLTMPQSLDELVQMELEAVKKLLQRRKKKEEDEVIDAEKKASDSDDKRQALRDKLHGVSLQMKIAEEHGAKP